MKQKNLLKLLKSKNIIIPLYIYKLVPKLEIDLDLFIFLMYLYNIGEKFIFNPQQLSKDFGIPIKDILTNIDMLSNKKLISFEIIKNDKNVSEEYLSLKYFYDKISLLLIEETNEMGVESLDSNLFEIIEKEFGRVLTPIELEIVKAWHEGNINDELIKEAVKEAVINGVTNLRYIDKILYEWQKKGFKNKDDIEKNRKRHNEVKKEKMEVFEYDWLEDD
ncbi:MAG: DnaD domain protein [bacterium]|nr:DnaD domain protein [bacterium]